MLVLGLIAAPWLFDEYWLAQLTFVLIYGIVGLGLMLLAGFTGLFSIGHAAFLGVGAYTHAVLSGMGLPFAFSQACATALSAGVAFVVRLAAIRVRGMHQVRGRLFVATMVEEWFPTWGLVWGGCGAVPLSLLGPVNQSYRGAGPWQAPDS